MQKSLIVWMDPFNNEEVNNIDELNDYLVDGWKVVSNSPMGGASYGYSGGDTNICDQHMLFGSLVILEKN